MITKQECMKLSEQLEKREHQDDFLKALSLALNQVQFLPNGDLNPDSIYGYLKDVNLQRATYEQEYAYFRLYVALLEEVGMPLEVFIRRVDNVFDYVEKDQLAYKGGMFWAAVKLNRLSMQTDMTHISYEFARGKLISSALKDKEFRKGVQLVLDGVFMRGIL